MCWVGGGLPQSWALYSPAMQSVESEMYKVCTACVQTLDWTQHSNPLPDYGR